MNAEELNITNDSQDKQFLDKVLGVVTDNYKDPYFDVMEFTAKMGVSRSLLHRKLDSLVGQSASKLIRTFRLNKAQILIEQSNRSKNISEIAYDVGFNDPKYFTRCFTKHFGFSPSDLIEKNIPKNRE